MKYKYHIDFSNIYPNESQPSLYSTDAITYTQILMQIIARDSLILAGTN